MSNSKEIDKIINDSFNDYYYMLGKHRTWDYVEMVKEEILTKLITYLNETKYTKSEEAES